MISFLQSQDLSDSFLKKIRKFSKEESAIFFRIELQEKINKKVLSKFGFTKGRNIQPKKTLILNISQSEKDLLEQMHQKTRYNIRLAEKKGIKIKKGNKKNFEKFWRLLTDTAKKNKFSTHSKEYYERILEIPGTELFLAVYRDKIIAANIVLFHNKQVIYLHGASDYNYRKLMAPFLLQWHQILEAKKRECIEYDFWGIDEKKWPGVTRFKKGFGGREIRYMIAYDLVFQPIWYKIYKIARKIL
jgi:lipid II:glycine glycyltransferase (peptidoglycan interpeptide bridge formation enzyme)